MRARACRFGFANLAELERKWPRVRPACEALARTKGGVLILSPDLRGYDQNRALWAMLEDIALQCEFDGASQPPEVWKVLMLSAYRWVTYGEAPNVVAGLEGEPLSLSRASVYSSRTMTARDFAGLLDYLHHYGDARGVAWGLARAQRAARTHQAAP